jgi:hypothetical protein
MNMYSFWSNLMTRRYRVNLNVIDKNKEILLTAGKDVHIEIKADPSISPFV